MTKAYGVLGDPSARQFVMTLDGLAKIMWHFYKESPDGFKTQEDVEQWIKEHYIAKWREDEKR